MSTCTSLHPGQVLVHPQVMRQSVLRDLAGAPDGEGSSSAAAALGVQQEQERWSQTFHAACNAATAAV